MIFYSRILMNWLSHKDDEICVDNLLNLFIINFVRKIKNINNIKLIIIRYSSNSSPNPDLIVEKIILKGLYSIKYENGCGKVPSGIIAFVVKRKSWSRLGNACLESGKINPINENKILQFNVIRNNKK